MFVPLYVQRGEEDHVTYYCTSYYMLLLCLFRCDQTQVEGKKVRDLSVLTLGILSGSAQETVTLGCRLKRILSDQAGNKCIVVNWRARAVKDSGHTISSMAVCYECSLDVGN